MQKLLFRFWQLIVGLGTGYGLGQLVDVHRPVDYKMLLEYLKVVISTPVAIVLVFTVLFIVFKEEFRALVSNLETAKFLGIELSIKKILPDLVDKAVAVAIEPKKQEIAALPPGTERNERALQLEEDIQVLRAGLNNSLVNSLSITHFWPILSTYNKEARQVDEIRVRIQRPLNSRLRAANIPSKKDGKQFDEAAAWAKWREIRTSEIEQMMRFYPTYSKLYSEQVFEKAVDNAFEHYLLSDEGGDYSYAMAS